MIVSQRCQRCGHVALEDTMTLGTWCHEDGIPWWEDCRGALMNCPGCMDRDGPTEHADWCKARTRPLTRPPRSIDRIAPLNEMTADEIDAIDTYQLGLAVKAKALRKIAREKKKVDAEPKPRRAINLEGKI